MRQKVRETVINEISLACELSGFSGGGISGTTRPLKDLEAFDSYMATEVAVNLSATLNVEIPVNGNVFYDSNYQPNTIEQITDRICELIQEEGNY